MIAVIRRLALTSLLLAASLSAHANQAGALPYDEAADARLALKNTIAAAKSANIDVLIIFGANWCEDCRALDRALSSGKNATLMEKSFKIVKIDIGRFDRNMDIAAVYGNPTRKGIPAAVILVPDTHEVRYVTRAGELADARRMSESGIYEFFSKVLSENPRSKP